jgi:hypothetical protein
MSLKVDLTGTRTLSAQIAELKKIFPEEIKAMILEVALVDIETYAKKEADIPVDTGRLRASIHTKYIKKPEPKTSTTQKKLIQAQSEINHSIDTSQLTYNYKDDEGNSFDGTLATKVNDDFEVVVGTNVKYAKKINRLGGGGVNSARGLPKGQGQHFFDKAINNGKLALRNELGNLAKRLDRIVDKAKKDAGKKG